ncbi:MAG: hypothetical protein JW955_14845 [Sedimentisphaerales bacterium]|nr:hypothetical protein [Sedimentisphaerales bacterium]
MTTEAQIAANRANAKKSTGPRTRIGKAIVARNAIKHGLFARQDLIAEEDPQQYQEHRQGLLGELSPAGQIDGILAERIVSLTWRLKRAERLQNELYDYLLAKEIDRSLAALPDEMTAIQQERLRGCVDMNPEYAVGRMLAKDYKGEKMLDRMSMYERRIEGSLYRTMHELDRVKLAPKRSAVHGTPHQSACSVPARASRSTGILPVTLLHGRDAHATETPGGVTTNGDDCAKQSQLEEVPGGAPAPGGEPNDPSRGRLGYMAADSVCETKPIAEVSSLKCEVSSGTDSGPPRETNPIDCGEAVCDVPARVSRSTGILPVTGIHGRDAHATETPGGGTTNGDDCAKQSQSPRPAPAATAILRPRPRVASHYHGK